MIEWIDGMCWVRSVGVLLIAGCATTAPSRVDDPSPPTAEVLVLEGRMIDGTGAAPVADGRVVIEGERIRCAGPRSECPAPAGARVIDVAEGTILPGLIDLHAHVRPHYLHLFLAAGVTSVRDANNTFDFIREIGENGPERPRIFWSGPLVDGAESVIGTALHVRTPVEAESAIETLARHDVDFVKLYDQLPPDAFLAAAAKAREHRLPMMADLGLMMTRGLTSSRVDALQAIEAGVTSIEHASGFALAYQRLGGDPLRAPLDDRLLDSLARAIVSNDVVLVPTLVLPHAFAAEDLRSIDDIPGWAVPEGMIDWWTALHASVSPDARERAAGDHRIATALTRRVAELGGRIGAGSDTPAGPMVAPGGGLHRELELLVDAGLTPIQALHAAAGQAAWTLGNDELGTLTRGSIADVLVVGGDPSTDIRDTRNVRYVIRAGRVHTPGTLNETTGSVALELSPACGLPISTASAEEIDSARLATLVEEARHTGSDALVVVKNGNLVGEWYFGNERGSIQTMSVTKSIVSMTLGLLIDSGSIRSIDLPVADYYPEWRQGRKRDIRIRHLLDHTSGLQNVGNAGEEIYPAPDAIQLALAAELSHEPGTHFSYNNKAVNLLGGIIERASGKPLDVFVQDALLGPLCIEAGSWYRDESGTPHAMAGLTVDALGLASLGQLMLDKGVWKGERLLSEEWIDLSTRPSHVLAPNSGLLWWLHRHPSRPDHIAAYSADGYLGQYIVVLPAERIVVVRQKRASTHHVPAMSFPGFADRVVELIGRQIS